MTYEDEMHYSYYFIPKKNSAFFHTPMFLINEHAHAKKFRHFPAYLPYFYYIKTSREYTLIFSALLVY